ncbi:hypothetical protein ACQYRI_10135 [Salmonella enterica]
MVTIAVYIIDGQVYVTSGFEEDLSYLIPKGVPFWYVNREDFPDTPPETWDLSEMGEPDGYGAKDQD